jgi:hypothetical protein
MKEYLIISQKDKWFSGRFDAATLTKVLNDHAKQGWRVITMATASRETLVSIQDKDELIVLLERDVPTQGQRIERENRLAEAAKKSFGSAPPPALSPQRPRSGTGEPDVYRLD